MEHLSNFNNEQGSGGFLEVGISWYSHTGRIGERVSVVYFTFITADGSAKRTKSGTPLFMGNEETNWGYSWFGMFAGAIKTRPRGRGDTACYVV